MATLAEGRQGYELSADARRELQAGNGTEEASELKDACLARAEPLTTHPKSFIRGLLQRASAGETLNWSDLGDAWANWCAEHLSQQVFVQRESLHLAREAYRLSVSPSDMLMRLDREFTDSAHRACQLLACANAFWRMAARYPKDAVLYHTDPTRC